MTFKRGIYFTTLSDNELYSIEYQSTREDAHVSHIRGALCLTLDHFFREISASMRSQITLVGIGLLLMNASQILIG